MLKLPSSVLILAGFIFGFSRVQANPVMNWVSDSDMGFELHLQGACETVYSPNFALVLSTDSFISPSTLWSFQILEQTLAGGLRGPNTYIYSSGACRGNYTGSDALSFYTTGSYAQGMSGPSA